MEGKDFFGGVWAEINEKHGRTLSTYFPLSDNLLNLRAPFHYSSCLQAAIFDNSHSDIARIPPLPLKSLKVIGY